MTEQRQEAGERRRFYVWRCPKCGDVLHQHGPGVTGCLGTIQERHQPSGFERIEVVPASHVTQLEERVRELERALRYVRENMPSPDVGDSFAIKAEMRCFERVDATLPPDESEGAS